MEELSFTAIHIRPDDQMESITFKIKSDNIKKIIESATESETGKAETNYISPITYSNFYNKHKQSTKEVGDIDDLYYTIGDDYIIIGGKNFYIPLGLVEFLVIHGKQSGGYRKQIEIKREKREK